MTDDDDPDLRDLGEGVLRLRAPNPSALTARGTNSYLVGEARPIVIDPGPDDPQHLAALLAALAGRQPALIIVTHAHRDHSALAPRLAQVTGVPVAAFGGAEAGRSAAMAPLAARGLTAGEGADRGFRPDILLPDGAWVPAEGGALRVIHTPGHMGGHICLARGSTLFSGDHVMGWATSVVAPPDGDMGDYMASLVRLSGIGWTRALPGHGAPVTDPAARIASLIAHRRLREAQVVDALAAGPADCTTLARTIYTDLDPRLLRAAAANVLAHLLDLTTRGIVTTPAPPGPEAPFALARQER